MSGHGSEGANLLERVSEAELAVLRRRAEELAEPVELVEQRSPAALVLEVGEHRYALPLDRVRRILGPGPMSSVPRGDHHLVGVRSAGGDPIVVGDLAAAFEGRPTPSPRECVVVVVDGADPLGLLAERVQLADLADLDAAAIHQQERSDVIASVAPGGIALLDPDRIQADPRFSTGPIGAAPERGDERGSRQQSDQARTEGATE